MVSDFVACYQMYLGSTISFYNFDNEGSIDFVACYQMYWESSRAWLRLGDLIRGLYTGAPHTFALNIGLFILKIMINFVTKS